MCARINEAIGSEREIVATRVFDAPRDLVFKMWTDPAHLAQWWGPRGFTSTIEEMDVRPGGTWRLVMHGPDGIDYPNHSVYLEIVPPERIVYDHLSGPRFQATATFADRGGKTEVRMRMLFESAELRDRVAKEFGAVEGLGQTLDRLGERLAQVRSGGARSGDEPFVISRVFDAPRETVFNAWTQRDHLIHWWGPKGFTVTHCTNDLRPGGLMHYRMESADGGEMWGRWVYREITPPRRLVFVNSFSDEKGGLSRHAGHTAWPLEMLSTITFEEVAAARATESTKTRVTIHWLPLNATDQERKTFDEGRGSMHQGWTGTFDQLTEYLARP